MTTSLLVVTSATVAIIGVLGCITVTLTMWWGICAIGIHIIVDQLGIPEQPNDVFLIRSRGTLAMILAEALCVIIYLTMVVPLHNDKIFWIVFLVALCAVMLCLLEFGCRAAIAGDVRRHEIIVSGFGLIFAFATFSSMVRYGVLNASGRNHALVSHYHGPARIVGYNKDTRGFGRATLTIAYGGSWACPSHPDVDCQVESTLDGCYWFDDSLSGGLQEQYWRYWDGSDHWDNFSCAAGFIDADLNNNDDNGAFYIFGDDAFDRDSAPDDWPYLINVIADCEDRCQLVLDSPTSRDSYYGVEWLKPKMMANGLAALFFFGMASGLRKLKVRFSVSNASNSSALIVNNAGVAA